MTERVAIGGMLTAMAVVLAHALAGVPNVELASLTVFVAGSQLGPLGGAQVGALAAVAISMTSPMGLPHPALLAAQVAGYASWGLAGGLAPPALGPPAAAALGFGLTAWFQLLVNAALVPALGLPLATVLAGALPFTAGHVAWNTLLFGVVVPPLRARLAGARPGVRPSEPETAPDRSRG